VFVLAIDTSSPAVTAGVATDAGELVAQRVTLAPRGHGELLAPSIADCLDAGGIAPAQVGAVVAGTGPGPYTGLRVGLVTAAAYAHALGIPAYGVCSLDAIAAAARDANGLIVASDARRKEVYWARYDAAGARVDGPHVSRPADVPFDGVTDLAGAAAEVYGDVWPPHVTVLAYRYPEPADLVGLALDRIRAGAPAEPLTPHYLRRPDAVVPGAPKTVSQR
jgi:tRNA threonylcarbamoyl adenosine modification protein YeaZ